MKAKSVAFILFLFYNENIKYRQKRKRKKYEFTKQTFIDENYLDTIHDVLLPC